MAVERDYDRDRKISILIICRQTVAVQGYRSWPCAAYLQRNRMNEFLYQMNYDEASYTVMHYNGRAEDAVIPGSFLGKPVTIIFDKLFAGHAELRSVSIPDTVTDLGEFVFDGCLNLRRVDLPSGLLYLWGYTFCRCGIEEIVLPDQVRVIPSYAFKDCKRLRKVVCGSGLKKISPWAFGGCEQLAEVVHGPDVVISPKAFENNGRILEIQYV